MLVYFVYALFVYFYYYVLSFWLYIKVCINLVCNYLVLINVLKRYV